MPAADGGSIVHLRAAGVSLVLDSRGAALPAILHWGADLGDLTAADLDQLALAADPPFGDSRIEVPERVGVLPTPAEGWVATPGLSGSRAGKDFSPLFSVTLEQEIPGAGDVAGGRRYLGRDETAQLGMEVVVELTTAGIIRMRSELTNLHRTEHYDLDGMVLALPVPAEADELLDFTGRHSMERIPQRQPFGIGTHLRESRKGKPGPDGSYLLLAGQPGFSFTAGQVWGIQVGWSGNQLAYAEHSYNGIRLLGAGELLLPGELRLPPGESYLTPWLFASWGRGLNELAGRFHHLLRSRPQHPHTPRPVVVNTWEAVYFDHQLEDLLGLAEVAASVGAERFVLDDGWFHGRRSDAVGLGDWYVDDQVWPDGLGALVDKVHGLGMDFGLWVEPEMVNLDSELARAHPDWIFQAGGRPGIASRQQYVLDLGNPQAYRHIADRLHTLLDSYRIASLKWDHNRMVVEAGQQPAGIPGVHDQTRAVYRLLAELKARHPDLEIESCAAGGGRIDLGILQFTDRVWPSDCLDPLERQGIQRWTQLLLPPELIGTHLGSPQAHSTKRHHELDFGAATALWGHLGIEWNLTAADPAELARVREWVALYKRFRSLLHTGRVVVVDHPDAAIWINAVIGRDARAAVVGITTMKRSVTWPPGRFRLPGLNPDLNYRLSPLLATDVLLSTSWTPEWMRSGLHLSGRALAASGAQLPALYPERSILLHLEAVDQ